VSPSDSSPRRRREREARLRAEAEAQMAAYRQAARRRAAVGIGVVVALALAVYGVVRVASNESAERSTTTTAQGTTTETTTGPTVSLPAPPPGSMVDTPVDCPAADGSSPRVTKFAEPPPMCLDPALDYQATIVTSRGTMTASVDTTTNPAAANNFVFLARYHYYDGLPFTSIRRGAYATVADPDNADGTTGPGYSVAPDPSRVSPALSPILVGLAPTADGSYTGSLLFALPGDQYTTMPPNLGVVGLVLMANVDPTETGLQARTVLQEINDAATPSGAPSAVITIESITVTETPVTPETTAAE
jgi:peptidyl-prolyl cis-trans isomerase B (cyclophilin B)